MQISNEKYNFARGVAKNEKEAILGVRGSLSMQGKIQ